LEINNFELFELDELRVCACGESISDKLRFQQLHADVIPQKSFVENVLQAIIDYENPNGLKFLIAKKGTKIAELLRENGANVEEIETYKEKEIPNFAKLKSLLKGGAIDEFIFTSPEDVFSLQKYANIKELNIQTISTNEITFQTLLECGIVSKIQKIQ
jgi:uroporphyrinogen-III synthase